MNSSELSMLSLNGIVSIVLSVTVEKVKETPLKSSVEDPKNGPNSPLKPSMLSSMLDKKSGVWEADCEVDEDGKLKPLSPDSCRVWVSKFAGKNGSSPI